MKPFVKARLNLIGVLSLSVWFAQPPKASAQSFVLSSTVLVGTESISVVSADVNGDGKPDLITANYQKGTLMVLTNDRSGNFSVSSTNAVGAFPDSAAAADVNGDSAVDLISANDGDNTLTVLTNKGNGMFTGSATLAVGSRPWSVQAADVNGDGAVDLVSANFGDNTLTVLTNDGTGAFALSTTLNVGISPWSVRAADVNADGRVDLVSAIYSEGNLTILTNRGDGTFALSEAVGVGYSPGLPVVADVSGDGKVDLLCAHYSGNIVTVVTNRGNGTFSWSAALPVGPNPNSLVVADLNGDDKLDLVTADSGRDTLTVLMNVGSGTFIFFAPPTVAGNPQALVAADLSGDGKPELIGSVGSTLVLLQAVVASPAARTPAYQSSLGAGVVPPLQQPRGVAVDRVGNVYVADFGNHRVVKFSSKGNFLHAWGSVGSESGQFSGPIGIAADSRNNVYVVDSGNDRIQKFTSDGTYLTQWASVDPVGVATDTQNSVYVSGTGVQTFDIWGTPLYLGGVQKFDSDGALLKEWAIDTTPFAQYANPWGWSGGFGAAGIAVDRNQNVYVAFSYYYKDLWSGWAGSVRGAGIEMFTSAGTYVRAWGDFVNYSIRDVTAPEGLAADNASNVYAANTLNNRIDKFRSDGLVLNQWGIAGGAPGPLAGPRGVAVDPGGNFVYVADSGNHRILVFAYRPLLNIENTSDNAAIISWPAAALDLSLQQKPIGGTGNWVKVTNSVQSVASENRVLITPAAGNNLYRLFGP